MEPARGPGRLRVLIDSTGTGLVPGALIGVRSAELARLYAGAPAESPSSEGPRSSWVRTNMVSTLDGAATGSDGRSGSINTPADVAVFELLRAWADCILVGAQTVRVEGYGPAQVAPSWAGLRRGRPSCPALAVVTASGRLPESLTEAPAEAVDGGAAVDGGEVLVLAAGSCPRARIADLRARLGAHRVIELPGERVEMRPAIDALAERGLRRILCEGGPRLLAALAEADVIDEWCHTIVSRVVGGRAPRIVNAADGPGIDLWMRPRLLLEADGDLIGLWTRTAEGADISVRQ